MKKRLAVSIIIAVIIGLVALSIYLYSEVNRWHDCAVEWCGRCGEAEGRLEIAEQRLEDCYELVDMILERGQLDPEFYPLLNELLREEP